MSQFQGRILVVGTSGSGKTWFARDLSSRTGIFHHEIDNLYHQLDWIPTPDDILAARLHDIAAQDRWIVDGNYVQYTREILWPRAEMVVWLDYPLWRVVWRVTGRTIRRIFNREKLWNGNRESLAILFSKDNIILWALTTHGKNRRRYSRMQQEFPNVEFVRLRSPREGRRWMAGTSLPQPA